MRLPGGERPIIDPEKLKDYVLSRVHPVGRFKAAFFASLGYEIDNWQDLDRALRAAAAQAEAESEERTAYGQKYRIRSILEDLWGARPRSSRCGSSSTTRRLRGS